MDEMPKTILTVTVSLIILAVGAFAFFTVYGTIGYSESQTETFAVSNPSVAQTHELDYYPKTVTSVYQYNGIEWILVDPAFYTCIQRQFTILPGGMTGS